MLLNTAGVWFGPRSATHVLVPFVWLSQSSAVQCTHEMERVKSDDLRGHGIWPMANPFPRVINNHYGLLVAQRSSKVTEFYESVVGRNYIIKC